jgi:hypothetical protein
MQLCNLHVSQGLPIRLTYKNLTDAFVFQLKHHIFLFSHGHLLVCWFVLALKWLSVNVMQFLWLFSLFLGNLMHKRIIGITKFPTFSKYSVVSLCSLIQQPETEIAVGWGWGHSESRTETAPVQCWSASGAHGNNRVHGWERRYDVGSLWEGIESLLLTIDL